MRRKLVTAAQINGQPIRASEDSPVIGNIVEGIQSQLDYMRTRHAQVLYASCVVTYPEGYQSFNPTGNISSAMRKFHQKANRENIELLTAWTMERNTSPNPHFNVICLADGTKTQSGFRLRAWLNDIWTRELGLKAGANFVHLNLNDPQYFPPAAALGLMPSYQMRICRNALDAQTMADNAINAASYYAKTHTKEDLPPGRAFGFSRIPKPTE